MQVKKRIAFWLRKLADFVDPAVNPVRRDQLIVEVSIEKTGFDGEMERINRCLDQLKEKIDETAIAWRTAVQGNEETERFCGDQAYLSPEQPYPYFCTNKPGHTGDHFAHIGGYGRASATWKGDE